MAEPSDLYDVDAAVARTMAAGEADSSKGFFEEVHEGSARLGASWTGRLPKNIGVGGFKAALNTLETEADLADLLAENSAATTAVSAATGVPAAVLGFGAQKIAQFAPNVLEPMRAWAEEWTRSNTLGDDITQGVAQFAIPFMAYMRGLGGIQLGKTLLNVGRGAVAESAAAGTAFDPHEGRAADLVQLGRESESRFGELLRTVSPDGSLVNTYINMMTDRENEGEWEGRFKNIVDSLAGSAAVAGVLKGAAVGFRAARKIAAEPMKVGPAAQRGSIGVDPPKPPEPKFEISDDKVMGAQSFSQPMVDDGVAVGRIIGNVRSRAGGTVFQIWSSGLNDPALSGGRGIGGEAYRALIDEAFARKAVVHSDSEVSEDAFRVYESLTRDGYNVVKDPSAEWVAFEGRRVLQSDRGQPVYKILPKQE